MLTERSGAARAEEPGASPSPRSERRLAIVLARTKWSSYFWSWVGRDRPAGSRIRVPWSLAWRESQVAAAQHRDRHGGQAGGEGEQVSGGRAAKVDQAAGQGCAQGGPGRRGGSQPRHGFGPLPGRDGHLSDPVGADQGRGDP